MRRIPYFQAPYLSGLSKKDFVHIMILSYLSRSEHENSVNAIYFAAPPTEMELILKVRKALRKQDIKVFTAREMIGFLEKNYGNCEDFATNKFDLLSLIEQEMCFNSKIFLRASGSSWSK